MEYKDIDFDGMRNKIVAQAYASAQYEMTEEQKRKLINDKFKRAAELREALIQSKAVDWHTDR